MKVKIISRISNKSGKRFIAVAIETDTGEKFLSFDKALIYELLPEEYSPKDLLSNDCEIYI